MKTTEFDYSRYFWQGEKVRLRPLRLDDAESAFIAGLDSPSRQVLQLGVELPTTVEGLRASLEKLVDCKDPGGIIIFTVETLEGENVGGLSYHSRDRKNGVFSFGVVIDRPHRQQGYAEDAIKILLRYGFRERRYQKCNSACVHTNEASIALHKALGFAQEGRVRRRHFFDGQYHDDILFGMTVEEFEAREGQSTTEGST